MFKLRRVDFLCGGSTKGQLLIKSLLPREKNKIIIIKENKNYWIKGIK